MAEVRQRRERKPGEREYASANDAHRAGPLRTGAGQGVPRHGKQADQPSGEQSTGQEGTHQKQHTPRRRCGYCNWFCVHVFVCYGNLPRKSRLPTATPFWRKILYAVTEWKNTLGSECSNNSLSP